MKPMVRLPRMGNGLDYKGLGQWSAHRQLGVRNGFAKVGKSRHVVGMGRNVLQSYRLVWSKMWVPIHLSIQRVFVSIHSSFGQGGAMEGRSELVGEGHRREARAYYHAASMQTNDDLGLQCHDNFGQGVWGG